MAWWASTTQKPARGPLPGLLFALRARVFWVSSAARAPGPWPPQTLSLQASSLAPPFHPCGLSPAASLCLGGLRSLFWTSSCSPSAHFPLPPGPLTPPQLVALRSLLSFCPCPSSVQLIPQHSLGPHTAPTFLACSVPAARAHRWLGLSPLTRTHLLCSGWQPSSGPERAPRFPSLCGVQGLFHPKRLWHVHPSFPSPPRALEPKDWGPLGPLRGDPSPSFPQKSLSPPQDAIRPAPQGLKGSAVPGALSWACSATQTLAQTLCHVPGLLQQPPAHLHKVYVLSLSPCGSPLPSWCSPLLTYTLSDPCPWSHSPSGQPQSPQPSSDPVREFLSQDWLCSLDFLGQLLALPAPCPPAQALPASWRCWSGRPALPAPAHPHMLYLLSPCS